MKSYPKSPLITLTVITLSGFHCNTEFPLTKSVCIHFYNTYTHNNTVQCQTFFRHNYSRWQIWCFISLFKNFQNVTNVQWTLLNGITDNVINRLMWSNLSRLTSPKFLFHVLVRFAYYYQSIIVIIFSLTRSDHIKQCPLYPHVL